MSDNIIDVNLSISEKKNELSVLEIFKDSFKLLKKTILPTLIIIFLLSLITAGLSLLFLTGAKWTIIEKSPEYNEILKILTDNPDYVLSDEENKLFWSYQTLFWITTFAGWGMLLVIPITLLMMSTSKIYSLYYKDEDKSISWSNSIIKPFNSGKRTMTALFLIIIGSSLITVGFIILIIPGILIIFYGIFSIFSFIIDEKEGMETIRGGLFYVRGLFAKLSFILLIAFFVPMLIQNYYLNPLLEIIGCSEEDFIRWINPTTRNYGMLYIYYFVNLFFQNILYFFAPVIYTVTFVQIRDKRIDNTGISKSKKNSKNIIVIQIEKNQNHFNCPNCNKKLPSSARKCFKCKQLFDIKFK